MSRVGRLAAGLLTPLLTLSLASCGGEDPPGPAGTAEVVSGTAGRAALLTRGDLGAGFERRADDGDRLNEGLDCLSRAARDFATAERATELEVEFRTKGSAGTGSQVGVGSAFSSFAEPDRAESTLDGLRGALQDCRSAEFDEGDATVSFDVSVSDDRSADALDQQVNVTLDGEVVSGKAVVPLVVEVRHFRIDNHTGTVSVSLLNAPDRVGEVDRLVERGVERFLDVIEKAS